jgi:hypothetical protein
VIYVFVSSDITARDAISRAAVSLLRTVTEKNFPMMREIKLGNPGADLAYQVPDYESWCLLFDTLRGANFRQGRDNGIPQRPAGTRSQWVRWFSFRTPGGWVALEERRPNATDATNSTYWLVFVDPLRARSLYRDEVPLSVVRMHREGRPERYRGGDDVMLFSEFKGYLTIGCQCHPTWGERHDIHWWTNRDRLLHKAAGRHNPDLIFWPKPEQA